MNQLKNELKPLELEILKEIKNGKSEYLYPEKNIEDKRAGEAVALFHLKVYGYITVKDHSNENQIGYVDVELTGKGKEKVIEFS